MEVRSVGVVAIGRNEGERLCACLVAARRNCADVVYVDSGSTDNSPAVAQSLGVHILNLDLSTPFTAARARNEGFNKLLQLNPNLQYVQFVDGDCEIAEHWITQAQHELQSNPRAAIACGRRRERYPNASIYNRLCDIEWNTPIGPAKSCGGDALIRTAAFQQVGGYNPAVIAGEEPEMCVRLRAAGWTIHRIDAEMTLHDAAMTRLSQWWMRNVRAGHAYAQGNAMHGNPPELFRRREVRSIRFWATVPPIATLALILLIAIIAPRLAWIGLAPLLLYPVLIAKIAARRIKNGSSSADSLLYAIAVVAGKFPQHLGMQKFRAAQKRGLSNTIIEYKQSSTSPIPTAQRSHDAT